MIKFAILSQARSGSSFLTSALKQHPDILMHGEIFHPIFKVHIRQEVLKDFDFDITLRQEQPIKFIKEIYKHNQGKLAVGFKIWNNQSQKGVEFIIQDTTIKKIILQRQNFLASFSSKEIAAKTKIFNIKKEKQEQLQNYQTPLIKFNEQKFISYAKNAKKRFDYYQNEIKNNNDDYLLLDYQQHIMNQDINIVLDFLGVNKEIVVTGQKAKLNPQSNMLDRFVPEDHEKIIKCLENISKSEWLYETPTPITN